MIMAVSRIHVRSGNADEVAERYRNRSKHVDESDGFLGVEILRNQATPEEFWVLMRFRSREAFERYRRSDAFKHAHHNIPEGTRVDPDKHFVDVLDVLAD